MPNPRHILVVLPNWVGDVVLATPSLMALRRRYPAARIGYLARAYVADVLSGCSWHDELLHWPDARGAGGLWNLVCELRRRAFDCAILLPNSFRSALAVWLARIPRRIGYARDARGWMLTDRIDPPRDGRRFAAISMLDYYHRLFERADCGDVGRRLSLSYDPQDAERLEARVPPQTDNRPLVVLNPGGAYGTAKLWPAERFAALAERLVAEFGARVLVTGTPGERSIGETIAGCSRVPLETYFDPPLGLGPLKALIERADLLVTNDTGPRHFAIAFGVSVVTIFGPTDPAWTETHFADERKVSLSLDCQPCQEKICPLGHTNCMRQLEVDAVFAAARDLLQRRLSDRASDHVAVRTGGGRR